MLNKEVQAIARNGELIDQLMQLENLYNKREDSADDMLSYKLALKQVKHNIEMEAAK